MAFITTFLILLFGVLATASRVEKVNGSEFHDILQHPAPVLASFLGGTEACKALATELNVAAATSHIRFLSIDCHYDFDLCEELDINAYPAIRLYRTLEDVSRYRGARVASDIKLFGFRENLPTLSFLDASNITGFKPIDAAVLIAYLDQDKDKSLIETFASFAEENHHEFTFGVAYASSLALMEEVPYPSIVCYAHEYGERYVFGGPFENLELQHLLKACTTPLIGELTPRNINSYLSEGKPIAYIFAVTRAERTDLQRTLHPVAKRYAGHVNFLTVDASEYEAMVAALDLVPGKFPAMVLHHLGYDLTFPYDQREKLTPSRVDAHILAVAQGKGAPGPVNYGEDGENWPGEKSGWGSHTEL